MKLVACVKVTPKVDQIRFDPSTRTIVREGVENEMNDADKAALEMALSLKDGMGGSVTVLSMGPPAFEPLLKLAVAMGADDAILLSDRAFAGSDAYATSLVLASAIRKLSPFDLVLCGEASSDGSTEQVPAGIAQWLGLPCITYVNNVRADTVKIVARRSFGAGYEVVESGMPALLSVELGCNSPRFPDFRRKRWVDREFKVGLWDARRLGISPSEAGREGSMTSVEELRAMPGRDRRRQALEGSPQEVAREIARVIRLSMGGAPDPRR